MTSHRWLVLCICWIYVAQISSQDCQSDTYDFHRYYNDSYYLDLTTRPSEVIAKFTVGNIRSASTTNAYLSVKVEGDQLIFSTTEKFPNYEKVEVLLRIHLEITYSCTTGTRVGSYYQNLLEANNHVPEFSRSQYDVTVPLPLPMHFDLSPFIDDGKGIVAVDYDLVNNSVDFTIGENRYVRVDSVQIGDKAFRGVLRLKEQVLKLPEVVELDIVGTDRGVPAKSSSAKVVITPDLTIEYNDPPAFKKTFISEDFSAEVGNTIVVELIPGTVHEAVEYTMQGEDAEFIRMSVQEDKSKATVVVDKELKPAKDKFFLNVVVEAKRSELQKAECVILIDLKKTVSSDSNVTTVEKTLSVLHLEEERIHEQVFSSRVDDCMYEIIHEVPNRTERIFSVNESTNWIVASKIDREDTELFASVDPPQFQLVLQLRCPTSDGTTLGPPIFIDNIPYSIDTTYLNVVVDDLNDNSPEFTYPSQDDVFAFPVARLSERLLPSKLLQVVAQDLDAGLNAIIRFSIVQNDHFGIDSTSGVVYPLKNALDDEEPIELEIVATDRDGAEDGNIAKLKIRVVPALPYQMSIVQVENVDDDQLAEKLVMIQSMTSLVIRTITGGYTSLGGSSIKQRSSNTVQRLIVVVFDEERELLSAEQFAKAMEPFNGVSVSDLEELRFPNKQPNPHNEDECIVYPYIIVMSVFIVMFVASSALCAYFWFKWRLLAASPQSLDHSIYSDNELVENPYLNAGSTPPAKRKELEGVNADYSSDSVPRSNRLVRSLSDMMIIDEDDENCDTNAAPPASYEDSSTNDAHHRRKSIRFSEDVERIDVF